MTLSEPGIFERAGPRVYTINPGRPFLEDLAITVRTTIDAIPSLELSDVLIYLPTRRAVRSLADAFINTASDARATLLPQIRALGDVDEDDIAIFDGSAEDEIEIPPAVSALERRLTLANIVAARDKAFDGQERWAGAIAAADELGKLLDSFYTEEVAPESLELIVPETLAEHWHQSLKFLSIITQSWPNHLSENNLTDPAERRVKLIKCQTERWRAAPPKTPVIIAGTTGSTPAVARMMKLVADLPMGCVLLPGLDITSEPQFWDSVDETHPQRGLSNLLKALKVDRDDVSLWPTAKNSTSATRDDIVTVALRPADASDSWREWVTTIQKDKSSLNRQLENFELIESSDEEREAMAIAIKIRQTIEQPNKTVMLVTPDRDLARRVSVKMRRWNITVDDSAGVPFPNSPCGTFLRLVAQWLADPTNAVALMSVLHHPLCACGLGASAFKNATTPFDLALRGLQPKPGTIGLREKIESNRKYGHAAAPILDALCEALADWPDQEANFPARIKAHLKIAERLAATDTMSGDERLWRGDDGEIGAAALAGIEVAATVIRDEDGRDYPDIFYQLIAPFVVRRRVPAHPRIAILGPLEARLQHADTVILGGLNEGIWPRDAAIDPFLSRPMRKKLGLPSPEQRIGLAAHDFAQLTATPSVMMTRATRAGGKPTKPSRWIIRLKNVLTGADALSQVAQSQHYEVLAAKLDQASAPVRIAAPNPRPPVETRPKKLYVTHIEKLLRDPYAIYARQILGLKKLDPHNAPLGPREIGNLFHDVLQEYVEQPLAPNHETRIASLQELFNHHAPTFGLVGEHLPFWCERIDIAMKWFANWDFARRQEGTPVAIEETGTWQFMVGDHEYTLAARADRIDLLSNGNAFIVDYKTGAPPPTRKQLQKFSPQLPLIGLITTNGGFEKLGATPVEGIEYVRVVSRTGEKKDNSGVRGDECAIMMDETEKGLFSLLQYFSDPTSTYPSQPRPQYVDEYGDYDHLARRRERNAQGGEE